MIEDGDRLCLGLSGGKDSMTLLHVLLALKKKAPIRCACARRSPQRGTQDTLLYRTVHFFTKRCSTAHHHDDRPKATAVSLFIAGGD